MTESEWLECEELPPMLRLLVKSIGWFIGPRGDRRFLLYACACCRVGKKYAYLAAVEVAERFADGLAGEDVRAAQRYNTPALYHAPIWGLFVVPVDGGIQCWNLAEPVTTSEEWPLYTHLLRCVFGNPFCPAALPPDQRTPDIVNLAQSAYDERIMPSGQLHPARIAVLSDALEEAGCDNEDILAHLRSPGPHVRGCWAVDLVLGKE
jgi:hypothetical protein